MGVRTKVIEARSDSGNWGRFLVGRLDNEFQQQSAVEAGYRVLFTTGYRFDHVWVLDLVTGEGACFKPGGLASADLEKHRIWVCPLFEPFLEWLYVQDLTDFDALPPLVELGDVPLQLNGYRRPGQDEVRWLDAVDEVRERFGSGEGAEVVDTICRQITRIATIRRAPDA